MYKQSASRNNRSKGFKAKHILQICLLLAVCFWLIYQVKRSHDKKEGFDTEDEKVVEKVESDAENLRLGRKDLPRITGTTTDEHAFDEEEENKHEDDEQDVEDNISEDIEDEIDENDSEKAETEPAREKEHVDEDNERDDNDVEDENRSKIKEREEANDDHYDNNDVKSEEKVHDGDSTNTREAREEQYKADDASSEVSHDNQRIMSEAENVTIEHTNDIQVNNNGTSTNVVVTEFKEPKNNTILSQNGTIGSGSGNENQTMVENILEHIKKSEGTDDENELQLVSGFNNTENVNDNVGESLLSDDANTMSVDSDEGANVIPHDLIDASDNTLTQDEKDSRMDLDTLPQITNEVQNTDDAVVE